MVPRKGLGLYPSNCSKNSHLLLRQVRRLYHWTVLVSTLLWSPIGTHGKGSETAPGTAAWDSPAWLGSLRPNGLRPRPFRVSAILSESSPRKSIDTLSEPSNFLMFLRRRCGFGLGACRTRPGSRAAGGLNENVASRHAHSSTDAFEAWRCIDAFRHRRCDQYSLLACRKGRIPGLAKACRRRVARRQLASVTSATSKKPPSRTARQACATWIAAAATAVDGTPRPRPAMVTAPHDRCERHRRDPEESGREAFPVGSRVRATPASASASPENRGCECRKSPKVWRRGQHRARGRSSTRRGAPRRQIVHSDERQARLFGRTIRALDESAFDYRRPETALLPPHRCAAGLLAADPTRLGQDLNGEIAELRRIRPTRH